MEERGVIRTSAIFISTRGKTVMYNTVDEVPPRLRRKLLKLNSNAATVLIADRRGLQELLRARSEQWSGATARPAATPAAAKPAPGPAGPKPRPIAGLRLIAALRRHWLEILLVGGLPLLLWLIFQIRL